MKKGEIFHIYGLMEIFMDKEREGFKNASDTKNSNNQSKISIRMALFNSFLNNKLA